MRPSQAWATLSWEQQRRTFAQQAGSADSSSSSSSSAEAEKTEDKSEAEKPEKAEKADKDTAEASSDATAEAAAEEAKPEESEAEKLQQELDELQEKIKAKKHELLLSLADFENNKKKYEKERNTRRRHATVNFARKAVELYAEFEKELLVKDTKDQTESCKALYEGVVMTRDVYKSGLERCDVQQILPELGTAFEDKSHEDAGSIQADVPAKAIAEVVTPGWALTGSPAVVLKKAEVKLAA